MQRRGRPGERAVRKPTEVLKALLEAMPHAAAVVDSLGKVVVANERAHPPRVGDWLKLLERAGLRSTDGSLSLTLLPDGLRLLVRRTTMHERARALGDQWKLTGREIEVLALLAEGLSTRVMAARLDLGTRTVESHVARILEKSGADGRGEIIARLWQHALGELNDD